MAGKRGKMKPNMNLRFHDLTV